MMTVVTMVPSRDAQHALHAADDAAGHATDDATHRSADRTGCAAAFCRAALTAAHNALGLPRNRHRKNGDYANGQYQSDLHKLTPFSVFELEDSARCRRDGIDPAQAGLLYREDDRLTTLSRRDATHDIATVLL
jgi:hypothetical protein